MGIPWEWELVTKLGMGRNGNRLHGNGREWECKKPFPGISSAYAAILVNVLTRQMLLVEFLFCNKQSAYKQYLVR